MVNMSIWTRLRAFATTPSDESPLNGAVSDKAPVSDVAYSESLVYRLADWPKYNPDEITRTRGYKIYLQMMMDEQVKAVVRFKRDAITGRRWFFEFEEEDEDEAAEDPSEDTDEIPGEDAVTPAATFAVQDGTGQQADSNVDQNTSAPAQPDSATPPKPKAKPKKGLTPKQKEKIQVFEQAIKQMEGSFIDALNGIMSAMFQGYSMTEKVYKQIQVNEKTWWGIQKLRIKPFYSFHFYTDEFGNTDKVQQRWEQSQTEIDINKFIHFVQNPDMDQHYGQSELREAYRAWFSKDMTIRLMNIHLERHASGFVWLAPKEGTTLRKGSPEFTDLQSLIQNMTAKTAWIVPAGIDVHFERPVDTRSFENAIAIHDKAIAKAMLVPNLLGITEQGQTGSYSQSQTQLDAFLWTLDSEANRLEECLNEQLFRQLGELNFGEPPYPRFRFKPISESVKLNIIKTWGEMMRFGVVKHTDTDEAYVREILEFPEAGAPDVTPPPMPAHGIKPGEVVGQPSVPGSNQAPSPKVTPQQPNAPGTAPVVTPKPSAGVMPSLGDATIAPKKQHRTSREAFSRAVKRVDFAVIDRRSTILTTTWTDKLENTLVDGISTIIAFIKDKDIKANPDLVQEIKLPASSVRKMREAAQNMLQEAWNIGTSHAQKEIAKAKGSKFAQDVSPLSGDAADKFLEARAFSFAGDVSDNARKKITTIIYNGIKGDWTLDEITSRIEDETGSTISPQMATGVRTVTFEAINEARYDFFTSPTLDNYVEALEYSAIIDGKTTEICQHLDGKTYPADSDFWSTYTPPNHFNCRSLLVPVTADDTWSESSAPDVQPQDGFA